MTEVALDADIPLPVDLSKGAVQVWLKLICAQYNLSPTALARLVGKAPSTLNRFLYDDTYAGNLTARTIQNVVDALKNGADEASHPVIGERVKAARLAHGLSQDALAEKAGCTQATIDKVENGRSVRSRYLPAIFQALNLPFEGLVAQPRGAEQSAGERLKDLRNRAKLSMADMATCLGLAGSSSYQRYEEEEIGGVPLHIVRGVSKALVGLGEPPVGVADVVELLGIGRPTITGPDDAKAFRWLLGL